MSPPQRFKSLNAIKCILHHQPMLLLHGIDVKYWVILPRKYRQEWRSRCV